MMTTTLKNNGYHLATAIGTEDHCAPAARVVRDGGHSGTLFAWDGREWTAVDLENREYLGRYPHLAVVTLDGPGAGPDAGLNQAALGMDMECGEWVVDADDLGELQEAYGDTLSILWTQD